MATHDAYWAEYDGLQLGKHQLLGKYLAAWFPILASQSGRVIYIDCHAGRGRHDTGDAGSPVLALEMLLEHRDRARILNATTVQFRFFEADQENYQRLRSEVDALGPLPGNVEVRLLRADYSIEVAKLIQEVREQGGQLAPSFAFVDPYGFDISMDLLNGVLGFPGCELLVNFMYRYIDMAMHLPALTMKMDDLFGSGSWRELLSIDDAGARSEATIGLFSRQLRAQYVTRLGMMGANGALKYVLFHATNHRRGRERMKEALWSIARDGSFSVSERDSLQQPLLLLPEPDLRPLEVALWEAFAGKEVPMQEVEDWTVGIDYLPKHVHGVLRRYRNEGVVLMTGYDGTFAFSKNPIIRFPKTRPGAAE